MKYISPHPSMSIPGLSDQIVSMSSLNKKVLNTNDISLLSIKELREIVKKTEDLAVMKKILQDPKKLAEHLYNGYRDKSNSEINEIRMKLISKDINRMQRIVAKQHRLEIIMNLIKELTNKIGINRFIKNWKPKQKSQ